MKYLSASIAILMTLLLLGGCAGKKRKEDASVHLTLGISYLTEGNASKALGELLIAESNDSRNPEIQAALGQAYMMKQAFDLAEKHFQRAYAMEPDTPRYANNLGALYLSLKRFGDARQYFLKAANNLLFQQPEVAWAGIGYAYFNEGSYLDAVSAYQKAVSTNPRYAAGYVYLGETYYSMGKVSMAISEYQRALDIFPGYADALQRLGVAYQRQKETERAIKTFEKVIEVAPDSEYARQANEYLKILR